MARKSNKAQTAQLEVATIDDATYAEAETMNSQIAEALAKVVADHAEGEKVRGKSVVPLGYKKKYAIRAVTEGRTTKAAKRANGDWLAKEMEAECIEGGVFRLDRFLTILELNGIDHSRWPNRNVGWEGRLRMSGAIVLRGIVKQTGVLRTPDTEVQVPENFRGH